MHLRNMLIRDPISEHVINVPSMVVSRPRPFPNHVHGERERMMVAEEKDENQRGGVDGSN